MLGKAVVFRWHLPWLVAVDVFVAFVVGLTLQGGALRYVLRDPVENLCLLWSRWSFRGMTLAGSAPVYDPLWALASHEQRSRLIILWVSFHLLPSL